LNHFHYRELKVRSWIWRTLEKGNSFSLKKNNFLHNVAILSHLGSKHHNDGCFFLPSASFKMPHFFWWILILLPIGYVMLISYADVKKYNRAIFLSCYILDIITFRSFDFCHWNMEKFRTLVIHRMIFIPCITIHFLQGIYAYHIAKKDRLWWFLQTFLLGFPSTKLLKSKSLWIGMSGCFL
jgi:hypothetical protein